MEKLHTKDLFKPPLPFLSVVCSFLSHEVTTVEVNLNREPECTGYCTMTQPLMNQRFGRKC